MKLNPKEGGSLRHPGQTRRIRDIFELTSLFINETYRFIDGLLAMGLAELSEEPDRDRPSSPRISLGSWRRWNRRTSSNG